MASELTRISWVKGHGLTELTDVLAAIDKTMETAVERGARGFQKHGRVLPAPGAVEADGG